MPRGQINIFFCGKISDVFSNLYLAVAYTLLSERTKFSECFDKRSFFSFFLMRESVDLSPYSHIGYAYITQSDSRSILCCAVSSTEMKLPRLWMCETSTEQHPCAFTLYFAAIGNQKKGV